MDISIHEHGKACHLFEFKSFDFNDVFLLFPQKGYYVYPEK